MKNKNVIFRRPGGKRFLSLFLAGLILLCGCSVPGDQNPEKKDGTKTDEEENTDFLRVTNEEPDTADPQCTDGCYAVPLNVFDRLVEVRPEQDGTSILSPSLAKSWEVSDDGLVYTFHLQEGVTFSNGSPFTSDDVEFTLMRALTHPASKADDIGDFIAGAAEFKDGRSDRLDGFDRKGDLDFSITLSAPYAAFLEMLSIPAYSILDKETTEAAGDSFGEDPLVTVGTGPFVLKEWNAGENILLTANPDCWSGAPGCDGVRILFMKDSENKSLLFEEGGLDVLDLEDLGTEAEYFLHGDIYRDSLCSGTRVGLTFIGLNESMKPLDDVRIRQALQLALDREAILMNIYGGRGYVENGIYPHGLIGFQPELSEIPYDPGKAVALLREAGYPDGFDLEISVDLSGAGHNDEIMDLAAYMWEKIGVRTHIKEMDHEEFVQQRQSGKCMCYARRYSVDYDDPDAIAYVFFGTEGNSFANSLCYDREDVIRRVGDACCIINEEERLLEYQNLERVIVQEDCAWIPLFSNLHYFVLNPRVKNFHVPWNGWSDMEYCDIVLQETEEDSESSSGRY